MAEHSQPPTSQWDPEARGEVHWAFPSGGQDFPRGVATAAARLHEDPQCLPFELAADSGGRAPQSGTGLAGGQR